MEPLVKVHTSSNMAALIISNAALFHTVMS